MSATEAQRSDDNAVTAAKDAFGISIGNEQIGLYSADDVRGFSPRDAGNLRIDGLYFDAPGSVRKLFPTTTMRVGITAQGYPFPAPTGLADYSLRQTHGTDSASIVLGAGPYDTLSIEGDYQTTSEDKKLSLSLGFGLARDTLEKGRSAILLDLAGVGSLRPNENLEFELFAGRFQWFDDELSPLIFVRGVHLPPRIRRRHFGQIWTEDGQIDTLGVIGNADLTGSLRLRVGIFSGRRATQGSYVDLFQDVDEAGQSHHLVIADPPALAQSYSGEARLSYSIADGPRTHFLHVSGRGRSVSRRYDGSVELDLGQAQLGIPDRVSKPDFAFREQAHDSVRQKTAGLAYEVSWNGLGQASAGLQKSFYRKSVRLQDGEEPQNRESPWLFYGSAAVFASPRLTFFGGYTRGLEESGIAPQSAVNRGAALPAVRTEQREIGLRFNFRPDIKLILGAFEIDKPYFGLDPTNIFREIGKVRHRGIETSLSSQPVEGFNLIVGALFLDPALHANAIEKGEIGGKPIGKPKRTLRLDLDYRFRAAPQLSFDATILSYSSRFAREDNRLEIQGRTILDIGARYRFSVRGTSASARIAIKNVTNVFGWEVQPGEAFKYVPPRTVSLSFAFDFPRAKDVPV